MACPIVQLLLAKRGDDAAIVTADMGGTHARFAVAALDRDRVKLGEPVTPETCEHARMAEQCLA